jgi:hypothetical protein
VPANGKKRSTAAHLDPSASRTPRLTLPVMPTRSEAQRERTRPGNVPRLLGPHTGTASADIAFHEHATGRCCLRRHPAPVKGSAVLPGREGRLRFEPCSDNEGGQRRQQGSHPMDAAPPYRGRGAGAQRHRVPLCLGWSLVHSRSHTGERYKFCANGPTGSAVCPEYLKMQAYRRITSPLHRGTLRSYPEE